LEQGGFCRKVIGGSINFVPKPAPTLGFMSRYHILILTGNPIKKHQIPNSDRTLFVQSPVNPINQHLPGFPIQGDRVQLIRAVYTVDNFSAN